MANSRLFTLVLLTIIKISKGGLSDCNYVYQTAPPQGQPIAADVCREIFNGGTTSWKKYICNGTKILEGVYNGAECTGDLISKNDVTSNIDSFECDTEGAGSINCQYVLRQQPCLASPATYTVEPIITETCIQYMVDTTTKSFKWQCKLSNDQSFWYAEQNWRTAVGDCSGGGPRTTFSDGVCKDTTGLEVMSKGCYIKVYGPTSDPTYAPSSNPSKTPTRYPTGEPTTEPTLEPTTSEPSKAPSNMPSAMPSNMPSGAPTAKVTEAFYSSTTKQATTTENKSDVSRIQIIQNLIFVSFIMIFMSFVL